MKDLPYRVPVTIIRTRYGGTYEGGMWAAFNPSPGGIPDDAEGSDPDCAEWWATVHANGGVYDSTYGLVAAVGNTCTEAYESLVERVEHAGLATA